MTRTPKATFDLFDTSNYKSSPRFLNRQTLHSTSSPKIEDDNSKQNLWGNAKPPTQSELEWLEQFGRYPDFNPLKGKLSRRVKLHIANLKQATRVVIYYHYLHRGRTMAQLPYWILIDDIPIGMLLFSLPRLSVPLNGIPPMNVLELARLWLSPDIQNHKLKDSGGNSHAVSVASCAVGKALKKVRQDWFGKYPHLPDILVVVSWADKEHHEGTIYKASNFVEEGTSGGTMHGNRQRPNGGRDQYNLDYAHVKSRYLYSFRRPLTDSQKKRILAERCRFHQLELFSD